MVETAAQAIRKTANWPIAQRRWYLIAALEKEKNRYRAKALREIVQGLTPLVLKQECRKGRRK
jgi:hypothetical protein